MDIRSILPKKGCKKIKRTLKYIEEVKELTYLQIENAENNLIKLKNDLIEKFKKNNKIKKANRENKFHGLKDIRNYLMKIIIMIFMKELNICLMKK